MAYKILALALLALEVCVAYGSWDERHAVQLRNHNHELVLYPRVGKRAADPRVARRRDFLNFLANSWQRTGSLRGAIHEIQDMTESKRTVPLVFPGPRVGRSSYESEEQPQQQQQQSQLMMEAHKKWNKARIGKKSAEDEDETENGEEKRAPFARLG